MSTNNAPRGPKAALQALGAGVAALLAVALLATGGSALASGGVSTGTQESTDTGSGDRYDRMWSNTSRKNKRWARRTAECESGRDPKAIGGGGKYRGAFQFLRSTWRSSPKSPGGDPIRHRYKVQAVVAVRLKQRDGRHHWPNCG
jgi:hypothetical protein